MELVSARRDVALVVAEHGLSQRRACKLLEVDRATYRYEPRPERNAKLRTALLETARQQPRYGYRRLWVVLTKRQGFSVSIGRVHRLYRKEGLAVRRQKRKRLRGTAPTNPSITRPNQEWALDFVTDTISNGRALRALTMIDGYTRECPAIEVDYGISSRQVTRVLERAISERAAPARLRCDNGPEFTSRHFLAWCAQKKIELVHIQPGKPMQNGQVESFNGRFRDECLNANWFVNLADARGKIEAWRRGYNAERPHSSLDYRTPAEFAKLHSRPTNGMVAIPPDRPSEVVDRTAVLAGKGPLTPRPEGRALARSAPPCMEGVTTGGSGGMA
jgi:putative transposase